MGILAMVGRAFARVRRVMAGVVTLLGVFQFALVLMARSIEQSRSLDTLVAFLPLAFQRSLGTGLGTLTSFAGLARFGFVHPVVVLTLALVAAYLTLDPAIEVEQGLVDLLLARAVPRHRLITRSFCVMLAGTVVIVTAMALALWSALALFVSRTMWPPASNVAAIGINLIAVGWCFGAFGLAVAAGARRSGSALSAAGIVAVFLYLLEFLSASWAPAGRIAPLSPFHYYRGLSIDPGSARQLGDLGALGGATACLTALAYWRFAHRDL
jgi:ABC-type transport system involved in multi-copper enzyme maturation permease subunit